MKTAPGLKGYIRQRMAARALAARGGWDDCRPDPAGYLGCAAARRPRPRPGVPVAVGLLLIASPFVHHDSRHASACVSTRSERHSGACCPFRDWWPGWPSPGVTFWGQSIRPRTSRPRSATYVVWAAAQQYALQSVVLLRLEDIGLREAAPLAAATLFSLVHAPNPGLMILTFLGGLLWCSTFRRHPNIAAVALSHAILAVVIVSTLPPAVTGGLRIGPGYPVDDDGWLCGGATS